MYTSGSLCALACERVRAPSLDEPGADLARRGRAIPLSEESSHGHTDPGPPRRLGVRGGRGPLRRATRESAGLERASPLRGVGRAENAATTRTDSPTPC